jgi:predicted DNA-binding protein (MmcQ/YjbR family)
VNIESFRTYCLRKKGVIEELPFGPSTLVFKVMGKIFALTNLDSADFSINLKCAPNHAEKLRAQYNSILPGYHMNKKHWNTIYINEGLISQKMIEELIDHSYELVANNLTKKLNEVLKQLN